MNEFKTYHPVVSFTYFLFVIGFACIFTHPICIGISNISALACLATLKGRKKMIKNLLHLLPILIITALINPLFNHEGATVISYLPSGNPLTAEACLYGLCSALMLLSVISYFSCYNEVITSEKFIYLFGRISPSMSLVISMALRFVPKFTSQLKVVSNTQKCMGQGNGSGSIIKRAKSGLNILSITTTWALEDAVETADSMKSRGYGLPGRTSFSTFTFDKRDNIALLYILLSGLYTLVGKLVGGMYFDFFPSLQSTDASLFEMSLFPAYFLLCMFPVIIEIWEVRKWKALISKI